MALACCTSAPNLRMRTAASAYASAIERNNPFAGTDPQHVADDQVVGRHGALRPIAEHRRGRACQQRDAVEGALGTDLLRDADGDVDPDDADRDERVERASDENESQTEQE